MYAKVQLKTKSILVSQLAIGYRIPVYCPEVRGLVPNGWMTIRGPWYPREARWSTIGFIENGLVTKVK